MGIDIAHLAISLIEKRLKDAFKTGLEFEIHGTPKTSTPHTTSPRGTNISSISARRVRKARWDFHRVMLGLVLKATSPTLDTSRTSFQYSVDAPGCLRTENWSEICSL